MSSSSLFVTPVTYSFPIRATVFLQYLPQPVHLLLLRLYYALHHQRFQTLILIILSSSSREDGYYHINISLPVAGYFQLIPPQSLQSRSFPIASHCTGILLSFKHPGTCSVFSLFP